MRGSYSGNTLAFQANAESSILLPRSRNSPLHTEYNRTSSVYTDSMQDSYQQPVQGPLGARPIPILPG